jgi:hypothetical protein
MAERNKRMAERKHPEKPDFFWCSFHQDYHHVSEFSKNRSNKYGIMSICRAANKIYYSKSSEKHGDYHKKATTKRLDRRHPTDPNLFWCGYHKRFEHRDEFYAKDTKIGLSSICKAAIAERKAQWYQDNIIKETEPNKEKLSPWVKRMLDNPYYFQDTFGVPATIENIKKEAKIYGM